MRSGVGRLLTISVSVQTLVSFALDLSHSLRGNWQRRAPGALFAAAGNHRAACTRRADVARSNATLISSSGLAVTAFDYWSCCNRLMKLFFKSGSSNAILRPLRTSHARHNRCRGRVRAACCTHISPLRGMPNMPWAL